VSNVLSEEKKKQVIALGQLGWSLRRIEKATGIRRETAAEYLKATGIAIRPPRGWGKMPPAKPANEVTADSEPAIFAKPANQVTTDSGGAASTCEPYREVIEHGVACGRNAMAIWQELVDRHGFPGAYESVKRFVRKQRGTHRVRKLAPSFSPPPVRKRRWTTVAVRWFAIQKPASTAARGSSC
jgi:hypothetical protein